MSYHERDLYGIYSNNKGECPGPNLMGANSLIGDEVYSQNGEDLGGIKNIMLDTNSGKVCYAILSYSGILGMCEKLFAVPWSALILDAENKRYILNVDSAKLNTAPGFFYKGHWPNMADETWANDIHSYYGTHFKRTNSMHSSM